MRGFQDETYIGQNCFAFAALCYDWADAFLWGGGDVAASSLEREIRAATRIISIILQGPERGHGSYTVISSPQPWRASGNPS